MLYTLKISRMDLHSGLPYWIVLNGLFDYYRPLKENIDTDVLIIGSGITGSLVAHELGSAGIPCVMVDKRTIATGSTAASTAQLQYEIDAPLCELAGTVGEPMAADAYRASLQAITDVERVFKKVNVDAHFKRVSSIFLASDKKGMRMLEKEYRIRGKHGLPVTLLDTGALKDAHDIDGRGALKNTVSAQMDCYKGATGLLEHHMKHSGLQLYSHTRIKTHQEIKDGYELITEQGHTIRCKYLIIAAGFESGQFLPKQVMQLSATYALVSIPVDESELWPERSLLWESAHPYFYMRTTLDNRMMIGGEDIPFKDPDIRDKLLRKKVKKLEEKFASIYPHIPFTTEMAWCGTFSSTKDSLPYIGAWPGKDRMLFALGYGGNGITFSMIAAQIIRNKLQGVKDAREALFSFER